MKNTCFLTFVVGVIISLFYISSCDSSYSEAIPLPSKDVEISSLTRSETKDNEDKYEVTAQMAQEYLRIVKNKTDIVSVEPYSYKGVTCFYIFNFEKGWTAITADARTQSTLAESDDDNLCLKTLENECLNAWLETTANFIYHVKTYGRLEEEINPGAVAFWNGIKKNLNGSSGKSLEPGGDPAWVKLVYINNSTVVDSIPHLLETKWGQKNPWNTTLPLDPVIDSLGYQVHFATGCVPTAVSQILYYFHYYSSYPSDLWHQITPSITQNLGGGKYKVGLTRSDYNQYSTHWNSMRLTQNGSGSAAYVSDLMMEIGVRMSVNYGSASTSSSLMNINELYSCGITSGNKSNYSYSTVKNNIVNNKPVLIVAGKANNSGEHGWVIDGLYDRTFSSDTTIIYYAYEPGVLYPAGAIYLTDAEALAECPMVYDGWSSHTYYSETEQYLLMNYGWDGQYDNGHYTIESSGSDWIYNVSPRIFYNLVAGPLY